MPAPPRTYPRLPYGATIAALPPRYPHDPTPQILSSLPSSPRLVVLDDDPTGTQTSHGISVLCAHDVATLLAELARPANPHGFFLLTNSRALPPAAARSLLAEVLTNVKTACARARVSYEVVLRGDSTLRGHFPLECDVVAEEEEEKVRGGGGGGGVDAWVLAPFFEQGGRVTVGDVHYVREGEELLVPVGETQFAEDGAFGYRASNLRDYLQEKAPGRWKREEVVSVGIEDIRVGGPERVEEVLAGVPRGGVVVVNAVERRDMDVFCAGVLLAGKKGKRYLYRTGAAFVSSRLGIPAIPPLGLKEITQPSSPVNTSLPGGGGLIVAGSYVPKTTAQLAALIAARAEKLLTLELEAAALLAASDRERAEMIGEIATRAARELERGTTDVLIMTSRRLIGSSDPDESLRIGAVVAEALVDCVRGIDVRPRYVIAKGGITSADVAVKVLGVRRARVVGQAAPGVPVWRYEEEGEDEEDSGRWRGVPLVVFPGNVGGEGTLAEVVTRWHQ